MRTYKKHTGEHLDGTRGTWRPSLVASVFGADGHPVAWQEIAIVSCHDCGAQYGVGGDDVAIKEDGVTESEVSCYNCKCRNPITFEKHAEPEGREHFAKLKEEAEQSIKDARIRVLHEIIKDNMRKELDEKALSEAKKIIPDDAKNPQELFRSAIASLKKD
jgi:hypothetical protein